MSASEGGPATTDRSFAAGSRSRLVAAGFVGILICLLVFGAIAEGVHEQEANALDALATPWLHSLANPTLDALMQGFTELGSTIVVLPLLVVALILLVGRGHTVEATFLTVLMAGSLILNQSLKLVFQRPRPQLDWAKVQPEYSFPSGHAMNSLVFFVGLAIVVWVLWGKRAGRIALVLAVALSILIGISRIYLGYHYFTDVVGGFVAGAAWLLIVVAAFAGGLRRDRPPASGDPAGPLPLG